MQRRLLLDVVIIHVPAIFKLLATIDQVLLIRRSPYHVLEYQLHALNSGPQRVCLKSDGLSCQRLDKELHRTSCYLVHSNLDELHFPCALLDYAFVSKQGCGLV